MGSNIKGGGRAILSDEVEEAIVSFLMSRRDNNKELPTSDHSRKREHKRFVKQLVETYERNRLMNKFNNKSKGKDDDEKKTTVATTTKTTGNKKTTSNGGGTKKGRNDGGKVRVTLVEAIYGKGNKKKGVGIKEFKEGQKKLLVFPRSSSIESIMKEGQTKLRMKKKPVRCFVVENKMEVNLMGDLSGVSDGATIYVTSQQEDEVVKKKKEGDEQKEEASALPGGEQLAEDMVDPLHRVKLAYLQRDRRQPKTKVRGTATRQPLQPHPEFDQHFDKLDELSEERSVLPAAACRKTILEIVQKNRVVVICGMTGCGKSTQIPQFLWEGMKASGCSQQANICVTQPRRVAATSLANRVADEMKSSIPGSQGSLVGHNVRLDRAVSDTAKIVYCTVGILLRMLLSPREESSTNDDGSQPPIPLSSVSHVVIDEVHERDMNTDFVLTLLRSIVLKRNQHIRIILMSATASATKFVQYFGETMGVEPVVISIPGRTFPVDINWLEDCEKMAGSRLSNRPEVVEELSLPQQRKHENPSSSSSSLSPRAAQKIDNRFIKNLICALVRSREAKLTKESNENSAILIFLPGKGEIDALAKVLYDDPTVGDRGLCNVLKLHSGVPKDSQQIVFKRAKPGITKVVLSTNIAETSVTIPGKPLKSKAAMSIRRIVVEWLICCASLVFVFDRCNACH